MRWQRGSSENLFYWLKALGITLLVLMVMVWQQVQARQMKRKLTLLRQEEDHLVYQNARMQSQINQWLAPSHLETLARKQLRMIPLDPQYRIAVERP